MAVSTTQPATTTSARVAAALAAPLTVRIIDGRLLLCAPTEERLATAAADAGVDLAALGTVAVLLDDGSTGEWYGAPVVGALKFLDWLTRTRPSVDVTVTAVAALIVDAVELTTKGELVPDLASDTAERTWSWRPAPGLDSAGAIGKVWFAASEAVADGDPDELLHGWFATTVAELALARLGPPQITTTANEARVHRWADQVTARSSAGAKLRFLLSAPDDLDGHFLLLPRFQSLTDPTVVLPPLGPDTADLLGTSPHDAVTLLACEWDIARRAWSELPENPADELVISPLAVTDLLGEGIGATRRGRHRGAPPVGADAGLHARAPCDGHRRVRWARRADASRSPARCWSTAIHSPRPSWTTWPAARGELVAVRGRWIRIDEETRAPQRSSSPSGWPRATSPPPRCSTSPPPPTRWTATRCPAGSRGHWPGSSSPRRPRRSRRRRRITATLRHYQEDGLAWLAWLEANDLGGILADDMGLGKTAQALAIIAYDIGPRSGRRRSRRHPRSSSRPPRSSPTGCARPSASPRSCASRCTTARPATIRSSTSARPTSWSRATA